MSEEPRGGPPGGVGPAGPGAWVHQDHPHVSDAPRSQPTPYDPSYPSTEDTRPLYRPLPGEPAAPPTYGWPGAPGPTWHEDPYGVRGRSVFDDLFRPDSPPATSTAGWPSAEPQVASPWNPREQPAPPAWAEPADVRTGDGDGWRNRPMTAEERRWAPAAHWLPLLTTWVGPLVVLLTVGERNARVRECAKESFNFEVTMALALLASVLLVFVGVGLVLVVLLPVVWLVLHLVAAARAGRGEMYRYPMRIRFLS